MPRTKKYRVAVEFLVVLWLLQAMSCAWALEVANVTHLRGTLWAQHADGSRTALALGSVIQEKDVLTTEANTYARIKFTDQSETVMRPETTLEIADYRFQQEEPESGNILLKLLKGGLRRLTGLIGKSEPKQDVLVTPVATIGIRGTHYGLLYCAGDCDNIPTVSGEPIADGLHMDVVEGQISGKNQAGELLVAAGQFAFVKDVFSIPYLVPPHHGVQVTIPPAILKNTSDGNSLDADKCDDSCAVE